MADKITLKPAANANLNSLDPIIDPENNLKVPVNKMETSPMKGLTVEEEKPKLKAARDFMINDGSSGGQFCSNYIRTTKYTVWSFFPQSMFY